MIRTSRINRTFYDTVCIKITFFLPLEKSLTFVYLWILEKKKAPPEISEHYQIRVYDVAREARLLLVTCALHFQRISYRCKSSWSNDLYFSFNRSRILNENTSLSLFFFREIDRIAGGL